MLEVHELHSHGLGPVSLGVAQGECVGLSVPSWAGKTLLLRAIADLDPHDGQVRLAGVEAPAMDPALWRRRVGLLPAEAQWWRDRVGEHFSAPDLGLLAALGFEPQVLDWQVRRCSTGERQRLALARLLENRPQVLLLDEPTASLDPAAIAQVETVLARYRREAEAAILWVSHDPAQLARVAERRLLLQAGRVQGAAV